MDKDKSRNNKVEEEIDILKNDDREKDEEIIQKEDSSLRVMA